MSANKQILPVADTPVEVSVATTLLPWRKDDNRARYLGYLACGFSPEESLYMLGLDGNWLVSARQSADFSSFELRIPEIRKELSKEYIELDFFRNFRLVLEKDYRTLKRSLDMEQDDTGQPALMTRFDMDYLLKLRSAYTPQQLQVLEQVIQGTGESFNFAKWVAEHQQDIVELSRVDTIKIRGRLAEKNNS